MQDRLQSALILYNACNERTPEIYSSRACYPAGNRKYSRARGAAAAPIDYSYSILRLSKIYVSAGRRALEYVAILIRRKPYSFRTDAGNRAYSFRTDAGNRRRASGVLQLRCGTLVAC